jgi:hypothetical protein
VGEPVVAEPVTGDQEARRLAFVDRIEQREHRHPEHLRDHPDRENRCRLPRRPAARRGWPG